MFSATIFSATMVAWLISIPLFWKNLDGENGSKKAEIITSFTKAAKGTFAPVSAVAAIVGFSTVAQSLPEFQLMIDAVFAMDISPAIVLIATICVIAGLTGSSSSAIRAGIPIVAAKCQSAGLTSAFIHRVSCFSSTIVDTLPFSSAIIINLGIADLELKEAYPPMFISTTLSTLCGTAVCALVMYLFPFLP